MKTKMEKKAVKKVGMGMQVKPVKLVLAPGGSLCPVEDLRNPNA